MQLADFRVFAYVLRRSAKKMSDKSRGGQTGDGAVECGVLRAYSQIFDIVADELEVQFNTKSR